MFSYVHVHVCIMVLKELQNFYIPEIKHVWKTPTSFFPVYSIKMSNDPYQNKFGKIITYLQADVCLYGKLGVKVHLCGL